ncbi:uncharacterized protein LOC110047326 [Orbicella faveolata]|uniref:uncharacterized protein LOC110047321 n=1 Tax=Orbicella faveolata TaxID=48498 RepID=UPI0009E201F7|nr:uncharacterized protein LOC110047321 [Orbicella faveolata]XP_020608730.1 uncharacterized protein LOC110047326 [Orbicella faveolata]
MDKAPYILLIVTGYTFLVGSVETKSQSACFSSLFIYERECGGGHLFKIHTGRRNISSAVKRQFDVSVTGTSTTDKRTRFTVVDVDASTNRKCIQFIDKRGTTYALKVINGTNLPRFEQYDGCKNSTSNDFLFEETETGLVEGMKTFTYEHKRSGVSGKMCLGVIGGCDKKLYLLSPGGPNDRRCLFWKIIV